MTPQAPSIPCICVDTECRIPYGLCHCGCGEKTTISPRSLSKYNYQKGEPRRFVHGHKVRKYATHLEYVTATRKRTQEKYRQNITARREQDVNKYYLKREELLQQKKERKSWLLPDNRKRAAITAAKRNRKYRDVVLDHYGNKCACCGETEKLFLEIDHVYSDGSEHRKLTNGASIAIWLIRNGFPPGFQILCSNCNQGKQMCGGVCPHVLRSQGWTGQDLKEFLGDKFVPHRHSKS